MKLVLPTLATALLCLHTSSGAFQLKVSDVYEWTIQNMSTATETPITVTILDSGASSSRLPADSGSAWKVLLERISAAPETLELFQFNDGELRWSKSSKTFPVEIQAPSTIVNVCRGKTLRWGIDSASFFVINGISMGSYSITTSSTGIIYKTVESRYIPDMPRCSTIAYGIWTDSVGPIYYTDGGGYDWVLAAFNGKRIQWSNLRFDTAIAKAERLKAAQDTLPARSKTIVYPALNDSFSWSYLKIIKPYGSLSYDTVRSTLKAVVIESPEDSANWIRRTLRVTGTTDKDSTATWIESRLWDGVGGSRAIGGRNSFLSNGWVVSMYDVFSSGSTYWRRQITIPSGSTAWASYRIDGTPLGGSYYFKSDPPSSTTGCLQMCATANIVIEDYSWTLVSESRSTVGTHIQPRATRTERLVARELKSLLATDPDATVRWTTLSGGSGRHKLSEFMKSPRRFGALWLQVRTSKGDVKEGLVLQTR